MRPVVTCFVVVLVVLALLSSPGCSGGEAGAPAGGGQGQSNANTNQTPSDNDNMAAGNDNATIGNDNTAEGNDNSSTAPCAEDGYSADVERIGVMRSADEGETWAFLGHACFHAPELTPVDPAPFVQDGQIVLYFFDIAGHDGSGGDLPSVMYRAASDDGLDFSVPTEAFSITSSNTVTDPAVALLPDGTYRMYVSEGTNVPSASGTDGLTFTQDDGYRSQVGGVPGVLVLPDDRVRLFVCGGGIVSLISDDGLNFESETGVRITGPADAGDVCDPHPIRLQSGSYLMTYKSRPAGEMGPTRDEVYLATSDDGLTWVDGDSPIATGSVPGLVQIDDGTLLIYYVDFSAATDGDGQPPPDDGPVDESDFTPATGAADAPPNAPIPYGPWNVRLRVATSPDGLTWTRTGVTITDQGDVPSVITVNDTVWVFYVIWHDADNTESLFNTPVAAYSSDLTNWTFKKLTFEGDFPTGYTSYPVDPTVIAAEDGYRMYFTLGPTGTATQEKAHTFSATSTDLIHWTFEGERLEVTDQEVLDPSLVWVGDHYEFFAGTHHATSPDGLTFSYLGTFTTSVAGMIPSNGAAVGGAYRYYCFTDVAGVIEKDIYSMTYSGGAWAVDDGIRLSADASTGAEVDIVRDPTVTVHPAGESSGYVMVYVAGIP